MFVHAREADSPSNMRYMGLLVGRYMPDLARCRGSSWAGVVAEQQALKAQFDEYVITPLLESALPAPEVRALRLPPPLFGIRQQCSLARGMAIACACVQHERAMVHGRAYARAGGERRGGGGEQQQRVGALCAVCIPLSLGCRHWRLCASARSRGGRGAPVHAAAAAVCLSPPPVAASVEALSAHDLRLSAHHPRHDFEP